MPLVRATNSGAKTILAHFHYCYKGQQLFSEGFDWASPKVRRMARLDPEQTSFMAQCRDLVVKRGEWATNHALVSRVSYAGMLTSGKRRNSKPSITATNITGGTGTQASSLIRIGPLATPSSTLPLWRQHPNPHRWPDGGAVCVWRGLGGTPSRAELATPLHGFPRPRV